MVVLAGTNCVLGHEVLQTIGSRYVLECGMGNRFGNVEICLKRRKRVWWVDFASHASNVGDD